MRISDWSSDVCSSDLVEPCQLVHAVTVQAAFHHVGQQHGVVDRRHRDAVAGEDQHVVLDVLPDLEGAGVLQHRLQDGERVVARDLLWRLGRAVEIEAAVGRLRSEEHTSELQSLIRISYTVFCFKKKKYS